MPDAVVVVGGGVSGLATAHFLCQRSGADAGSVTVLEADADPGGKIRTRTVAGLPVDTGPDAFLARAPELRELLADLDLTGEVIEPLPGGAYVWSRGRLRPLPPGAAFGLPERLWPLLRSGLLSPTGTARAGLDLVLPRQDLTGDPSVADLVRPRFGADVYQRLVEPLLGGVHAGDPAVLSAQSTAPEIAAMARSGRSLTLTMRSRRRAAPAPPPGRRPAPLVSLRGGMGRLTDALTGSLAPGTVRTGVSVEGLRREGETTWQVTTSEGPLTAGHVVLAVPAYAAADLLESVDAGIAALLRGIPYVDVANATLAYRRSDVPELPSGTGFLVPPVEGAFVVGCTWLTGKWPHLANDDVVLVKCMVGRYGDRRWLAMSDDEIVSAVRADLRTMMRLDADPAETLVQRWHRAMPQYVVGHSERLQRIEADADRIGSLSLTGAAYRGVGLAGCVAQARATADRIADDRGAAMSSAEEA